MKTFPFAASPCRLFQNALCFLLLLLIGLALTGCGTSTITAAPNPLDFSTIVAGQSKDLPLSVTFASYVTGTYFAIDSGANPGDFQVVSQNVVGATGTRSAVIRFTPTAAGTRTATLTIKGAFTPGPSGQPVTYAITVPLTGKTPASLAASLAGAALQFDGIASRITVAHNAALNAYPFTAEAWIKTTQSVAVAALVSKTAPGASSGWQMVLKGGRVVGTYSRDSANYISDVTGGFVADGQWHHVAFAADDSGGTVFVDGITSATGVWHGAPGPCSTNQDVSISAYTDGSAPYFGQMDEIRCWNVARTAGQMQVNLHATQKENENGLLAYYRLDEGNGTAISDATMNHFNGTLSGSAIWTNSLAPIDTVVFAPGQPRTFRAAGFDINGSALTFANTSSPAHGTLSVNSPFMTYAPGANFIAPDTFTYTASNGTSVSDPATVRLLYRTAGANTILVPSQYPTLQSAVNAAVTGDTVLVANGTYTGAGNYNVDFGGKGVLLKSMGGSAVCIVDCQSKGRAFYLSGGDTSMARIEGFTITNGAVTTYGDYYGGGVRATNGNSTVANCLFLNNTVSQYVPSPGDPSFYYYAGWGGGMYGGTAINCIFTGNSAASGAGALDNGTATNCTFTNNQGGAAAGGMYGGTATHCVFTGNHSAQTGGGMYGGTAINCTFTNNSSGEGGGLNRCTATNCVVAGNSAFEGGGLAYCLATHCTIVGNAASKQGGGMECYSNPIVNCVVWGNTAPSGPQILVTNSDPTAVSVTYSDVQGGWTGAGNISADPLFVNASSGDYHLQRSSPCINAGTATALPSGVTLPTTDIEGNPRIVGPAPDMGAFEYSPPLLGTETDYATGIGPASVAASDVNGDSLPDLVTANFSANTVSVLLGTGSGSFGAPTDYAVGSGPHCVVIADINNDGWPDIVTANYNNNTVSVLLGNGDGTFGAKKDYQVGYGPFSLALADVNGDGLLDVVTVNLLGYSMTVLLNTGNGTLGPYTNYDVGTSPRSIALADVNGDGRPDVVIANNGANSVSVFLNNGSGLFGMRTDYAVDSSPASVAVADVNSDGKPDIVTANYGTGGGSVSVLLGAGNGTFGARANYAVGTNPQSVVLADVNGDGLLDVVTANYGIYDGTNYVGGNSVSVLPNNGQGTFYVNLVYPAGAGVQSATVMDVSGDGRLDIVTALNGSNAVGILLNTGIGGSSVSGVVTLGGLASNAAAQNLTFQFRPVSSGTTITKTAYVLPNGVFHFDGLPANNFMLRVKGDKMLASAVSVNASSGSVSGVKAVLLGGDADNSNVVDIGDFGLLVNAYNSDRRLPGSGYDFRADFTGDGVVDIGDFGILVNNYNQSGAM